MRDRQHQILVGLIVAGALLRFATLDLQSFDHDEAVTAGRILEPELLDTLSEIPASERTPPFYYALVWAWSKLFGTGEVGLRSLSALAGTATVPVAFGVAAGLVSRRAGLVVAALVAVNPFLVWYSQQARAYALLALLAGVSLLFFAKALKRPTGRLLTFWALAASLALATHYFAVFVVAPQALWLLLRLGGRRAGLAVAAVGAAGLALLPLAIYQVSDNPGHPGLGSVPWRQAVMMVQFLAGESPGQGDPGAIEYAVLATVPVGYLLAAFGLVLLMRRGGRDERRGAGIAAFIGGAGIAVPLALAFLGADVFTGPNVIAALLPLLVVVSAGFGARQAGRHGLAGAAALCACALAVVIAVNADPRLQRHDWRSTAAVLGPETIARAIVSPPSSDDPLALYLGLRRVPERGVRVREIDMLGLTSAEAPMTPPAPGFELVERRMIDGISLLRFRSGKPRRVTPDLARGAAARFSRLSVDAAPYVLY